MLEKIGLPAKPSLRGNNWVVDASHCQGCSSQFTFINRKHHCRRCGGLFCNSCTQHRMVLRGQGDSPVRICEPCKQLEEAARFEMRYGHRSRAGRGGLRPTLKDEDGILSQILGEDRKQSFSSTQESGINAVSNIQKATSSASYSNAQENDGGEIFRSSSLNEPSHVINELGSASPEELHQQALEEKKKYKSLKGEGKAEEALKAFKRGKELERQAGALELLVRKNRRKDSNKSVQKTKDVPKESGGKYMLSPQLGKAKDDVVAELKELGWSDVDIHGGDKKPVIMSLEGELSTLVGEFSQRKDTYKGIHGIDKAEVVALKKKALVLKHEGKLTEAKEELKRAKVLEKQLEEQEFFVDAEDSDDEISSLIRSMDVDEQNDLSVVYDLKLGVDFNHLVGVADDFDVDNFDVTNEDMNDPEIVSALTSLGWADESNQPEVVVCQFAAIDRKAVLSEIQSLKRMAVNKKRAGNASEAMQLLKKAKSLEKDLDSSASEGSNSIVEDPEFVQKGSKTYQTIEKQSWSNMVDDVGARNIKDMDSKLAPKSKLMIQKELLGLKKKALALRREGRLDEAEELKKGKALEQQLEDMDNTLNAKAIPINDRNDSQSDISRSDANDGEEGEVTDQDLRDPTYLALLKNLGWNDDNDNEVESFPLNTRLQSLTGTATQAPSSTRSGTSRRSKAEIQRELLGLKRKALVLRRQGDTEGAEEILKMASVLETEVADIEEPKKDSMVEYIKKDETIKSSVRTVADKGDTGNATEKNMHGKPVFSMHNNLDRKEEEVESVEENSAQGFVSRDNKNFLQQEILNHKRKAVALKREGKLADAGEELQPAKLLEKNPEEGNPQPSTSSSDASMSTSNVPISGQKEHTLSNVASKPLSARDRFKLQQESLAHKRQALKLRREGRTEEAESEFELAKALEAQLEESSAAPDTMKPSANRGEPVDDLGVVDILDPQLLSSLKTLGLENVDVVSQNLKRSEPMKLDTPKSEDSSPERVKLGERIKGEKVKAVNLKRSGKQAEALAAFRQAKLLEKKLNSLDSK